MTMHPSSNLHREAQIKLYGTDHETMENDVRRYAHAKDITMYYAYACMIKLLTNELVSGYTELTNDQIVNRIKYYTDQLVVHCQKFYGAELFQNSNGYH